MRIIDKVTRGVRTYCNEIIFLKETNSLNEKITIKEAKR
jgi:hypothetical protein